MAGTLQKPGGSPDYAGRLTFHKPLQIMEVDFSHFTFSTEAQVHQFYDEIERQLEATGDRWYFIVNYQECVIEPAAWEAYASRGKSANIKYSRGTVRVSPTDATRDTIAERAKSEHFRSNFYKTREEALVGVADMRRRQDLLDRGAHTAAERTTDAILTIEDVSLSFGGVHAIQNVSFQIERGEILAIIGPNGAGKTSMLNVINGFYQPQRGRITFKGETRAKMRPHEAARGGIARTFQNVALFRGMTALDNIMAGRTLMMHRGFFWQVLRFGPALREEIEHRHKVEEIIDFLEIPHIRKVPVGRLPYGLQKRVELGRALAMEPDLLLLDEPMAGMNLEEKEDMSRYIVDVNNHFGTTIALIEHDMGVVMDLSSFVVVLDHGMKISEGPPDQVQADPVVIRAYLGVAH